MESEPVNIGNSLGNYYMFYSAPALFNNRDNEFGTVIAEAKNKLIVVDDEIIREHVYSLPKTKVDHYGGKPAYFYMPEKLLKECEM